MSETHYQHMPPKIPDARRLSYTAAEARILVWRSFGPGSRRFEGTNFRNMRNHSSNSTGSYPRTTGILRNDTVRTANLTSELMLEMSCYLTLNLRHARLHLSYKKHLMLRNKRCDSDDSQSRNSAWQHSTQNINFPLRFLNYELITRGY